MKTALFDLDGTLIDSRADLALAINLTRQDFALPPKSVAEIVACVGEGVRLLIERALSVNTAAAGGNASLMTIG